MPPRGRRRRRGSSWRSRGSCCGDWGSARLPPECSRAFPALQVVLIAPIQRRNIPPRVTANAIRTPSPSRPSAAIFDIPIDLGDPPELLRAISSWATEHTPPAGDVRQRPRRQSVPRRRPGCGRALGRADLVYCDGYGVRLAARVLNLPVPHRMTGADWIWGLATLCELGGQSVYLLGSEPPIAREAAERCALVSAARRGRGASRLLRSRLAAQRAGDRGHQRPRAPHRAGRNGHSQAGAVGRPIRRPAEGAVVWTVGALFDYVSGHMPRAPGWLADNGLEWIFRLAVEPRRMWRRYLLGNPMFLSRVLSEARAAGHPTTNGPERAATAQRAPRRGVADVVVAAGHATFAARTGVLETAAGSGRRARAGAWLGSSPGSRAARSHSPPASVSGVCVGGRERRAGASTGWSPSMYTAHSCQPEAGNVDPYARAPRQLAAQPRIWNICGVTCSRRRTRCRLSARTLRPPTRRQAPGRAPGRGASRENQPGHGARRQHHDEQPEKRQVLEIHVGPV